MRTVARQLDGIVRYHYSADSDCVCCHGRHVFAVSVDGIPSPVGQWVGEQIRGLADGTPVRLILEVQE